MKEHWKTFAQELLNLCHLKGDDFLKNIAIGDESWVHHYDWENKRQSMGYRHPGSPSERNSELFHQQRKSCSPSFRMQGVCFTWNF
jgi:hypothetical protein